VVGNYDMAPTSFQAASDTAGHVGTILELARLVSAAPHRRTFLFLFVDGEEWGMLGARHFARTFAARSRITVALSIEDLDVGRFTALGIDATGQSRGFAPFWLRELAADAARREGVRTDEVGPLFERLQRSLLVSRTDQGPFLAVGVPAIDLAGRSDDLNLKSAVYHLPADTIEKMRMYPPPPRHPLLTTALPLPLLVSAVALIAAAAAATAPIRMRGGLGRMDPTHAARRVTAALSWLLILGIVGLYDNPFGAVTFLLLPGVLWIWISPGRRRLRRTANAGLALLGFVVVVLLFVQYAADLRIGPYNLWYVFMALAYAQFTPLQIMLTFATLAVALRLLALGTVGRIEPAATAPP
jgi:hypothetical protein